LISSITIRKKLAIHKLPKVSAMQQYILRQELLKIDFWSRAAMSRRNEVRM
jgi:hypothetical protein